jgi:hypothetical protein
MQQPTLEIYKFVLHVDPKEQRYMWPYIDRVISIQMQNGVPVMWALVQPKTAPRLYKVMRFLTGDEVFGVTCHLGTVQLDDGTVLHYFAGGPGL